MIKTLNLKFSLKEEHWLVKGTVICGGEWDTHTQTVLTVSTRDKESRSLAKASLKPVWRRILERMRLPVAEKAPGFDSAVTQAPFWQHAGFSVHVQQILNQ